MTENPSLIVDSQRQLVITRYAGDLNLTLGVELVARARELACHHRYHLLYDLSGASLSAPLRDIYEQAWRHPAFSHPVSHQLCSALVVGRNPGLWRFVETTAHNAGIPSRLFLNELEALSWLMAQPLPSGPPSAEP